MQRNAKLENLFYNLLEQLESAQSGIVYLARNQLDKADPLGVLQSAGLVEDSQPLTDVICDGCDWRCHKPVQFRYNAQGIASAAFIMCDETQDMGKISVDFGKLEMWKFTLIGMATWLANNLATDREPQEMQENRLFYLGTVNQRDLYFVHGINQPNTAQLLANTPAIKQSSSPMLLTLVMPKSQPVFPFAVVGNLASFSGNNITLSTDFLNTMPSKSSSKRGAKPKHDWPAYRKKFDEVIEYYGLPGIDQPELKNQAALETKLVEWGEKTFGEAPSPASIRRYVSQWLKSLPAHN